MVWAVGGVDGTGAATRLGAEIESRLTPGAIVVLHCVAVTFLSPGGLRVLAHAVERAEQVQASFVLASVTGPVRQALERSGLSGRLIVFDSIGQAKAELGRR